MLLRTVVSEAAFILPFHCHPPFLPTQKQTPFPISPLKTPKSGLTVLSCSSPRTIPSTEQEVLKAVVESDEKTLPCVRTYENDLARLSLVGSVDFHQALTASAADGGDAAAEHLESGMPAMVVETVFPGTDDEHSTISTRLFLPAAKVQEKARKLRRSLGEDVLSSSTSNNILAMTFRQVVLENLWNFELVVFGPGTERIMEDLGNPREVPPSFTLSSSDERVISVLAEVVCTSSLQSTERHLLDKLLGQTSSNFFRWHEKSRKFSAKDSSITIYEGEVIENAKSLLKSFKSASKGRKPIKSNKRYNWWMPSTQSKLEKIGGPEFCAWISEYIPVYKLQIDADKCKDLKFGGWEKIGENRWEALLTHSQMVGLANILDIYYEDPYSVPSKELPCNLTANYADLLNKKRNASLFKMLSISLATGIFLVVVSALGQVCLPPHKILKYTGNSGSFASSETDFTLHQSMDLAKLEAICVSLVQRIKDGFGWSGDIMLEAGTGAWTGKLPLYLRTESEAGCRSETDSSTMKIDDIETSAQDIASYQVVLSPDGKIVGFQPTSRVAVNHWAANPLTKELYGGRNLSPGLVEPGLNVRKPEEVVVIELLVSENPDASFALARPYSKII